MKFNEGVHTYEGTAWKFPNKLTVASPVFKNLAMKEKNTILYYHKKKKRKHFSSASVRSKRTYLQNEILSREKKQTQISKQKKPHHKLSHRTRWHEGDYQRLDNWNILFSKMAQFPAVFFFLWNLSTKHKTCFWPLQTANAIKQNWRSDTSLSDFAFWFILEQLMWLFG